MNIITEAIEMCPHCDSENTYPNYDAIANNYIAVCHECKKEIFLCDECTHADDNLSGKCDWEDGKCFRGECR